MKASGDLVVNDIFDKCAQGDFEVPIPEATFNLEGCTFPAPEATP